MSNSLILDNFIKYEAYMKGHFLLSSGRHSENYLQCAKVLQYPSLAESYAKQICSSIDNNLHWDYVVAPAMGGLIIGHEVARCSQKPFVFMERENNTMTFRRGLSLKKASRVLVIEDVITTGGSALEVIEKLEEDNHQVVAVASIVNRQPVEHLFTCPYISLLTLKVDSFLEKDCPLCLQKIQLVKPGSRSLV